MPITVEEAADLFERRVSAWLAEDIDAYLSLWADDMTFCSPVHSEPLEGKKAYEELIRGSLSVVRPVAFYVGHLAVRDDLVLAEWSGEIERRSDGASFGWDGMSICEIRWGLIAWWREYWNPAAFLNPVAVS